MWPILLWLLAGSAPREPARGPLLVSAAVSLTEALTECGEAFRANTRISVRFNFGASNTLARQIVQGAPVDVFVSADQAQMTYAVREGMIRPDSVRVIASNQLVVIVPEGAPGPWRSAAPLGSPEIRRIAVGDPTAVPAGVYAREWLQRIGLWKAIEPKLVPGASVRGALSAVRTGGVDAGIVYRTDARSSGGVAVVFEVTGPEAPTIEYPAGLVAESVRAADARAFVEFLQGASGQAILRRWGFGPGSEPGTR
ncbi:MAG: molybdate ABC transporter substrate-binding protein [Acidobacteriota bacterium]